MNILPFEYLCVYQPDGNEFTAVLSFSDITLTEQLGKFPIGYKFATASIDLSTGQLTFESCDGSDDVYRFNVCKLIIK